jgi:hypothetical protein
MIASARPITAHAHLISSISAARFIGCALEQLGFSRREAPMDEHGLSTYA